MTFSSTLLILSATALDGRCDGGLTGQSKCGTEHCWSYWGYCGTGSASCGSGGKRCVCGCSDKSPCISGSSGTKPSTKSWTDYKTTAPLDIRKGHGTRQKVVKTAKSGTTLYVVSASSGWAKLNDGTCCSAKYLSQSNNNNNSATTL